MVRPVPICRMFETQVVIRAFSRAWAKTGKRMAARIAMMAITTSSSIRVNARLRMRCIHDLLCGLWAAALVPADGESQARMKAPDRPLLGAIPRAGPALLLPAGVFSSLE